MNRPTLMTRFIGRRLVAAVLLCRVARFVADGWYGAVPWWLGLAALCFAGAVRKSRRGGAQV